MGFIRRQSGVGGAAAACAAVWLWVLLGSIGVGGSALAEGVAEVDAAAALRERAQQLDEAGEHEAAMALYRRSLELDRDDLDAYKRLWALSEARELHDDPALLRGLAEEFPEGTRLRRTAHFLIVYNTSDRFAETRATVLETTYRVYYTQLVRAGYRPLPIERRLVAMLFDERKSYLEYAERADGLKDTATGGYYSSRTNRIAFFNNSAADLLRGRHGAALQRIQRQMQQLERRAFEANRAGRRDQAAALRQRRARLAHEYAAQVNRLNAAAGLNNIASTVHEAVHQLAYNSGIQSRRVRYPFWVSEGLATSFESTHIAADFGPTFENRLRSVRLRQLAARGELMPLGELIAVMRVADDVKSAEQRSDLYAQAWGLFHYLFNRQGEALRAYLRQYATARHGELTDAQLIADFEAAFGTVEQVERAYRAHIAGL